MSKEKYKIVLDPDQAAAALCRKPGGFYFFVQEFWEVIIPEKPVWNWHIEYLCNEMEPVLWRLVRREDKIEDVIINIPPGTSKSTIMSIMLPAFAWGIDPSLRLLLLSYTDPVAIGFSMKCRDIVQSDKYRRYFPDVKIRKDSNSKAEIQNTKHGQIYATGLGGSITGKHFHYIGIDDPLNPKEAASEAECAAASSLIDSTLSTRKVNKASTVTSLIMQRLSDLDPTAHLLGKKEKKIKHIRLPGEVIDGPLPAELAKNYSTDGLLDPVRLTKSMLGELLTDLGSANYAGQISQQPVPKGGLIWKKWFIEVPDDKFPDRKFMTQYGTDWDTAYTKDDENAASAYVSAGKIGNKIYLDDFGWDWLEFPALIRYMKQRIGPHYIEAKASGKSAKSTLSENGVIAIEIQVKGGDKIARANMATPIAESGVCYIRKSMADRLYNDPRQGILKFPRGKFKDLADVLAQCLQRLGRKGGFTSHAAVEGGDRDDY